MGAVPEDTVAPALPAADGCGHGGVQLATAAFEAEALRDGVSDVVLNGDSNCGHFLFLRRGDFTIIPFDADSYTKLSLLRASSQDRSSSPPSAARSLSSSTQHSTLARLFGRTVAEGRFPIYRSLSSALPT